MPQSIKKNKDDFETDAKTTQLTKLNKSYESNKLKKSNNIKRAIERQSTGSGARV